MGQPKLGRCRTTIRTIAQRHKQAQALELRKQGKSYAEIAEVMEMSTNGVGQLLHKAITAIVAPGVEEVRKIESARLDVALNAIWTRVELGELDAIHTFLRISERRARLLGLDMPVKVANTDSQGRDNPFMEISAEGLRQIAATVIANDAGPTTPEE